MANNEGVYVFSDAMSKASGIDPGLLALLNQNGGFGGNGNWIWILFLWMIWGRGCWRASCIYYWLSDFSDVSSISIFDM